MYRRQCKSPARIIVILKRSQKRLDVDQKLQKYNERNKEIVDEMIKWNVEDFAASMQKMHCIIKYPTYVIS